MKSNFDDDILTPENLPLDKGEDDFEGFFNGREKPFQDYNEEQLEIITVPSGNKNSLGTLFVFCIFLKMYRWSV